MTDYEVEGRGGDNEVIDADEVVLTVVVLEKMVSKEVATKNLVVVTTAQLHLTKPELRFCAASSPAGGVSEIRDGEDL